MRAPVVAALPTKLLTLLAQRSADEDRASLVQQPVRLRLAQPIRPWRVEAIEHALVVEEAQPVLGSAFGAEKEQRQLVGGEQLVLIQRERDRAVALRQVPSQLEDALAAHAQRARARSATTNRLRQTRNPSLSGSQQARKPARRAGLRCFGRRRARQRKRHPTRQPKRPRKRSRRPTALTSLNHRGQRAAAVIPPTHSCEQQLSKQRNRVGALLVTQRLQPRRQQHSVGATASAV